MSTISINEINSNGIQAQCEIDGISEVEIIGTNGKTGDAKTTAYWIGGVRVIDTNGDPVWEEQDPESFAAMMEEIEATITITITSIEESDRNCSTDVVDVIHLSDGRQISAWNGNASYCVYDRARGRVEVGSALVSVEDRESYSGEAFQIYTFA
jgi:hypothetical protein